MDKQKEIEEMDEIIYQNACDIIKICGTCKHGKKEELFTECVSPKIAKALSDAGYRKADEVRKETAKEILKKMYDLCMSNNPFSPSAGCLCKEEILEFARVYGIEVDE